MSWISVDVEADGPIPGDYSMLAMGAVVIEPQLKRTFYARLRPISAKWSEPALRICGFTRQQTLGFEDPTVVLLRFKQWLQSEGGGNLFFVSDNCFDWQYVNWYFHHFLSENPFGISSTNIISLYAGIMRDVYRRFRHRKKTSVHNPLDDACVNAQALLRMKDEYGLRINW